MRLHSLTSIIASLFIAICFSVTVSILIRGFKNRIAEKTDQPNLITILNSDVDRDCFEKRRNRLSSGWKLVIASIVWLFSSLYVFAVTAGYLITGTHSIENVAPVAVLDRAMIILIAHYLVWLAIGAGLIYWMNRQTEIESERQQR